MGGGSPVDEQLAYDTLLVAWMLGLALYLFHLGGIAGSHGWPRR